MAFTESIFQSLIKLLKCISLCITWAYGKLSSVFKCAPNRQEQELENERVTLYPNQEPPKNVNYHFARQFISEFDFAKPSFVLTLYDAMQGLKMLKDSGMEKINFSGGEPFVYQRGKFVGELVKYCKTELGLRFVSIVSNGSCLRETWFKHYGQYLDLLAITCESFYKDTTELMSSVVKKSRVSKLIKIHEWCNKYNVIFNINTVVNRFNCNEDMAAEINDTSTFCWKVFRCSVPEEGIYGTDSLRTAELFDISDEEFDAFIERHKYVPALVPVANKNAQSTYLILDEFMRFLDFSGGKRKPTKSILDIGVANALLFSEFDDFSFKKRGGVYKWSKND